jgi:glycerol-3-phosphate acyltransferase PlsY
VGIAACLTWLATAVVTRISSLSALVAAGTAALWMLVLGFPRAILLAVLLAAVILWRHRGNISRILNGTEPKIGKKD